jgi:hypothetical protein
MTDLVGKIKYIKIDAAQAEEGELWHQGTVVEHEEDRCVLLVGVGLDTAPDWAEGLETSNVGSKIVIAVRGPARALLAQPPPGAGVTRIAVEKKTALRAYYASLEEKEMITASEDAADDKDL